MARAPGAPNHSRPDVVSGDPAAAAPPRPGPGRRRFPHRRLALGGVLVAVATTVALVVTLLAAGPAAKVDRAANGVTVREVPIGDGSSHLIAAVTGGRRTAVDPPTVAAVAASESAFGLTLTRLLAAGAPGHNVVDSPLSAAVALAMLELGARGATQAEVAHALQAPAVPAPMLASAWAELEAELRGAGSQPLQLANSVWLQRGVTFAPSYLAGLARTFGDDAYAADFAGHNGPATAAVNQWVAQHTGGSIRQLFPPGSLDRATILVLANALDFTALWAKGVDMSDTTEPFAAEDGSRTSVPALHHDPSGTALRAAVKAGYEAVEIPYQGGRYEAVVVQPPAGTIDTFVDDLDPAELDRILASLQTGPVALTLPALDVQADRSLDTVLAGMGMPDLFRPGADLSGISPQADHIGVVQQADRLVVNKDGTHFAAATGIGAVATSARVAPEPLTVTIDRPYVFLIRDDLTGLILADTVIDDPAQHD
jgi:serpin B